MVMVVPPSMVMMGPEMMVMSPAVMVVRPEVVVSAAVMVMPMVVLDSPDQAGCILGRDGTARGQGGSVGRGAERQRR